MVEVGDLVLEDAGEAVERLTEGHGHGVFELRAAHLQDVGELLGLAHERVDQRLVVLLELEVRGVETHVDGRRIGVVGRLRAVHVVVGRAELVFAALVAHDFEGAVGDHFVGVHVGGRARTALDHVHGEELVVLALHDLAACLCDGLVLLVGEQPQLVVGDGCAQFHDGQTVHEEGILVQTERADGEILQAAQRLHAVEYVAGNLHAAEQVALGARFYILVSAHDTVCCILNGMLSIRNRLIR